MPFLRNPVTHKNIAQFIGKGQGRSRMEAHYPRWGILAGRGSGEGIEKENSGELNRQR